MRVVRLWRRSARQVNSWRYYTSNLKENDRSDISIDDVSLRPSAKSRALERLIVKEPFELIALGRY